MTREEFAKIVSEACEKLGENQVAKACFTTHRTVRKWANLETAPLGSWREKVAAKLILMMGR